MINKKSLGLLAMAALALAGTGIGVICTSEDFESDAIAQVYNELSAEVVEGTTEITGNKISVTMNKEGLTMGGSFQKIKGIVLTTEGAVADYTITPKYRYDDNQNHLIAADPITTKLGEYVFAKDTEPARIDVAFLTNKVSKVTIKYACDSGADVYNKMHSELEPNAYVMIDDKAVAATKAGNEYKLENVLVHKGQKITLREVDAEHNLLGLHFKKDAYKEGGNPSKAFTMSEDVAIANQTGFVNVYYKVADDNPEQIGGWINMKFNRNVSIRGLNGKWDAKDQIDLTLNPENDVLWTKEVALNKDDQFKVVQQVTLTDGKDEEWWQGYSILEGSAKDKFAGADGNNIKVNEAGTYVITMNIETYKINVSLKA